MRVGIPTFPASTPSYPSVLTTNLYCTRIAGHNDSGYALESILFWYGSDVPLPEGHEWSFVAAGCVHAVLQDQPMDKAQIVEASGITDSEWRTTIRLLEERKIASCTLGPRQRKAASNRAYRYTRGPAWADAVDVVDTEVAGG